MKLIVTAMAALLFALGASAVEIEVEIFGTIEDPASSGLEAGDSVQASFNYESSASESPTGNYLGAAYNLFVLLIDESEGGAFVSTVNQPDGDLFIGTDEFSLYYGPEPLQQNSASGSSALLLLRE